MGSLMDIALEAGNLNYAKRYKESIKLLDKYFNSVKDRETLAQFHISYAMNYEKLKEIEKCNYHCEEAVKLYHIGIYAYKRLIINYVKAKDWEDALRICNLAIDRGTSDKSLHWGDFPSYAEKRKKFILKKIKGE
jgi:pentatricopeptide repeat protein